jgi:glutamate formiminotransferase
MKPKYLIECIPNVSTADPALLERMSAVIEAIDEVDLRFVDPGESAHRTVFTYLGPAHRVFEATFRLFELAKASIDMRVHSGVHPRMGAVDVCPFVLLDSSISQQQLEQDALAFGARLSAELDVALYGYEALAKEGQPKELALVRKGEYEGLAQRFSRGDVPQFGPQQWSEQVARFGATAFGVRPLMVAYNVNLSGLPKEELLVVAKKIAAQIRARDGGMPGVKSIGWYLPDFDAVQVSCNLTTPEKAGVCEVFKRVKELAASYGCEAQSSELIGCIPQSQFTIYSPEDLGFGNFKPFTPKRILPL